ncbi:hypothetical protein ACN47E_010202 [Coniothyrium glycines]
MDPDRRLTKAIEAANDALQHLSMSPDLACLDCTHIDRLLGRVVDLPTEGNQRNSRRNLLVIRQWMMTETPGVVLLEVLGQLYWRLGELNSKQFEKFKMMLQEQELYLALIQNTTAVTLVIQRIQHIQRSKAEACQDFLCELSDLTGFRADSPMADMEALRAGSSSPFTPLSVQSFDSSSSQEFGFASLIKYTPSSTLCGGDMEKILTDFYIRGICPGRTVATCDNSYVSLLQVAKYCVSTRYALLSLSASYISDYLPGQKEVYHQAELYYSTQALKALATQISDGVDFEGALSTSMLLMHHGAVNQEDSPLCWSCHANILEAIPSIEMDYNSDPALFICAQLALSRSAQTKDVLQATNLHAFETKSFQANNPSPSALKISNNLGFSPHLLSLICSITNLAVSPSTAKTALHAHLLSTHLHALKQWTPETPGAPQEILLATAECFRLAALIYLQTRLYGYTRFHPSITELNDALCGILLNLPVKGSLYTAIYPVWPFFMAAVTAGEERRETLCRRVGGVYDAGNSTFPAVLRRVGGLRVWLAARDDRVSKCEGWWDEMLSPGSSTMRLGRNMLCLG